MKKNKIYFLESDLNLNFENGVVIKQPFKSIDKKWKRKIIYLYYCARMLTLDKGSFMVVPWGMFWIPAIFYPLKRFRIISLSCDSFISEKVKKNANNSLRGRIKYEFIKATSQKVARFAYCSNLVKEQLVNFGIPDKKIAFRYEAQAMDWNYERFDSLLSAHPDLMSNTFLFVGHFYKTMQKRLDILLGAYKKLKTKYAGIRMIVVGADWDYFFNQEKLNELASQDVIFVGRDYNIKKYIEKSSFYIHPGEYEAFALSVFEAMTGGLIPIVSNKTGARELVNKIDPRLVVDLTVDDFYNAMEATIKLTPKDRLELSLRARQVAAGVDYKKSLGLLKDNLLNLINDL